MTDAVIIIQLWISTSYPINNCFIVYAHGVDNLRDREKHGSESITEPQCLIDLL